MPAVQVEVIKHITRLHNADDKLAAIADLVELQLLFILRAGEYTVNSRKHTRKV